MLLSLLAASNVVNYIVSKNYCKFVKSGVLPHYAKPVINGTKELGGVTGKRF